MSRAVGAPMQVEARTRLRNAVASSAWGLFAGSVGAFWAPLIITHFRVAYRTSASWPLQLLGALLVVAGLVLTVATVRAFVRSGGTPIPGVIPPELVVTGPNAYVRNPIYLGMLFAIAGETLVLGRWILFGYGLFIWLATAVFVRVYEEPILTRKFEGRYEAYRRVVPGWLPHRRRWQAGSADDRGPAARSTP